MTEERERLAERIEPCPFCGGEATCFFVTGMAYDYWCGCEQCQIYTRRRTRTGTDDTERRQAAIDAWNKRTALRSPAPALSEEERRLREFLSNHAAAFAKTPKPDHVTVALSECELGVILSRLAAPAVPEEVMVWFKAHDDYHRAVAAYNDRVKLCNAERERDNWSINSHAEYETMNETQKAALRADEALYKKLAASPPAQAESREDIRNAALEMAANLLDARAQNLVSRKRTNQVDRHTSSVLARARDAIRALKSESQPNQSQTSG